MSVCGTLFRCTGLLVHTRRVCATPCPGISFFLHRAIGAPEPRRRFTLSGRQFFQHRLSGVRELPQAGSPLTGGKFSAEPQRGVRRLRTAGACRAPRQGKRVDTKVSTLLTPTSFYFLVWRRPATGDRFEIRERQSGYRCVSFVKYSQFTDSVLLRIRLSPRRGRHDSAAYFFVRYTARHLRI